MTPLDPAPFIEHSTRPECPNLRELPAFHINKQTPLTVIELCGGIGTGLEALLKAGYKVGSYTWADINPDGHTVLQHTIPTLHKQYPKQFPTHATQGWDTRLPFDINLITRDMLMEKFPNGAHIIIAGPPGQPYSIAGKGKGLTDKRSSALLAVARTITHLSQHQNRGVGYVIENVPGVRNFQEVLDTLGEPVLTDAPPCGSLAKRATLFWTNLKSTQTLQSKYNDIENTPIRSLERFLRENGFAHWEVPYLVGHSRAPEKDKYNTIGKKLAILPKFVSHPNARAYRRRGGYGRLLHKNSTAIPCIQIKEMVMGFDRNRTEAGGLAEQHRHYLMGQCIDLNLLTWFLDSCAEQTEESPPLLRPPQVEQQPMLKPDSMTVPSSPHHEPTLQNTASTLPLWQQAHNPHAFIYTDGSKTEGAPVLGAAGFNPAARGHTTYIDATGSAENNTVVRAELTAIYHALQENQNDNHIHILTDSLTAIQKILLLHSQPLRSTKDHHHYVLQQIAALIEQRAQNRLTTHISKVPAHTGVWGNEIADKAAKSVVHAIMKHRSEDNVPYPEWVTPTDVPMQPYRQAHVLTDDPPPNPDGTQPSPRVLTTKSNLHRHIKPMLRLHTAPPSTYHSLMIKARTSEDPTDLTNTARYITALINTGARHHAKRLLAFIWGTMYTQKHAFWFGHSRDQICPVCNLDTDSCTHVGSGCRHPHLKSLYIDRHSAAVRMVRNFISMSPVGASLTLICEDSGVKPLPEDLLDNDNFLAMQDEFLQRLPQHQHIHPPTYRHSPLDHRLTDVTLELKDDNLAAADVNDPQKRETEPDQAATHTEDRTVHQTIPEWVLPKDAQQRLLLAKHGFKPDLLFIKGAPSPHPAVVTEQNLAQWKITVIEIGFCADLRLEAKNKEKTEKYNPLIKELRKRWSHVHFITVPIGNAGAMLASTKQQLATLVSTQPQKKKGLRRSEQLVKSLAMMAARRFYGVTVEYYRLRREGARTAKQKNSTANEAERRDPRSTSCEPNPRTAKRLRLSPGPQRPPEGEATAPLAAQAAASLPTQAKTGPSSNKRQQHHKSHRKQTPRASRRPGVTRSKHRSTTKHNPYCTGSTEHPCSIFTNALDSQGRVG